MCLYRRKLLTEISYFLHTIGPTINPHPKSVSSVAKEVPMLFGNSDAIIVNEAVKNAAFPSASTILMTKASAINASCSGTRSRRPNNIALVPVVKTPP